jgi:hypothetical protein
MAFLRSLIAVSFLLLMINGCASTRLTDVWKDPAYKNGGVSSIMVLAVAAKPENRRMFETHLAAALKGAGVTAVLSSDYLPGAGKFEKNDIKRAAAASQSDGVIITHLVGVENKEVFQPPVYDRSMYNNDASFGYYYAAAAEYVTYPGAVYDRTEVRLETNLFNTASEALMWRASSTTIDPDSVGRAMREISQVLVNRLKKSGMLKTP